MYASVPDTHQKLLHSDSMPVGRCSDEDPSSRLAAAGCSRCGFSSAVGRLRPTRPIHTLLYWPACSAGQLGCNYICTLLPSIAVKRFYFNTSITNTLLVISRVPRTVKQLQPCTTNKLMLRPLAS